MVETCTDLNDFTALRPEAASSFAVSLLASGLPLKAIQLSFLL
jgi:hypothetical protein